MKHLKRMLALLVLASALTVPAIAGDISCGRTSEQSSTSTSELCGDIYCGVTQTAATLILSLL